jgi:hypothetical protein
MSAIRLNGQYVLARDVEKKDFAAFVSQLLPRITAETPIPHAAATLVAEMLASGKTDADPTVQAGLQSLASLGVRNFWTDGGTATVTEETPTDASQGLETAFGFAAIESGLAMAAAACNAFRRTIKLNEAEIRVVRQSREVMVEVAKVVSSMKTVNEPVFVTAGRYLGGCIKQGKALDAPETMTALCMLSDLGVTMVKLDIEQGILGFGPFSVANAMASAILQGLDAEKVASVRKSIERSNDEMKKAMAEQQAKQAGQQSQQQTIAVPSVLGTRRRR